MSCGLRGKNIEMSGEEKKRKKKKADIVVCEIILFHNLSSINDRLMHLCWKCISFIGYKCQ